MFLKNIAQNEHTFPFKTVYFLGFGGLTTSSYTVYDYTTIENMDLWNINVLYIQYICISIQYTYISIQYIYLFISNAIICERLTFMVFGTVHLDRTVVILLHKHFSS